MLDDQVHLNQVYFIREGFIELDMKTNFPFFKAKGEEVHTTKF